MTDDQGSAPREDQPTGEQGQPSEQRSQQTHAQGQPSEEGSQKAHAQAQPSEERSQEAHAQAQPSEERSQEAHAHERPSEGRSQEAHAQERPSEGRSQHGHAQGAPSEEEMRAAYEAEMNRITSHEMILQSAVSLLNIGGRRLGLVGGSEGQRDLDQVRDAIDAVRGLMPVLERRMGNELGPLRDALAQLQMAFAREANVKSGGEPAEQPAGEAPAPHETKGAGPAEATGRLWVPGR